MQRNEEGKEINTLHKKRRELVVREAVNDLWVEPTAQIQLRKNEWDLHNYRERRTTWGPHTSHQRESDVEATAEVGHVGWHPGGRDGVRGRVRNSQHKKKRRHHLHPVGWNYGVLAVTSKQKGNAFKKTQTKKQSHPQKMVMSHVLQLKLCKRLREISNSGRSTLNVGLGIK